MEGWRDGGWKDNWMEVQRDGWKGNNGQREMLSFPGAMTITIYARGDIVSTLERVSWTRKKKEKKKKKSTEP